MTASTVALPAAPVTLGTSSLGEPVPEAGATTPPTAAEVELAVALLTSRYALIDTSNAYARGRSEAALGAAIAELGGLPEGRWIISKADRDLQTGAFDRDRVWRSFEESTARLGLERLPLYQLHDPYTVTFAEAMAPGGAVAGLLQLREQGLIGATGIAAGPVGLLTEYVRTGAFDVLLTHNRLTLVDDSAADLVAEAADLGLAVLNAAPFGGGLLATGSSNRDRYGYRPAPAELLGWVERFQALCDRHGVSTAAVALHSSLRRQDVHSTVVGISSRRRLEQLGELLQADLPEEIWPELAELGTPPTPLTD